MPKLSEHLDKINRQVDENADKIADHFGLSGRAKNRLLEFSEKQKTVLAGIRKDAVEMEQKQEDFITRAERNLKLLKERDELIDKLAREGRLEELSNLPDIGEELEE